jgi:dTDP-D-glucose 4,6-dehydratase
VTLLVTGGAGFIGANFVLYWLAASDEPIINLDKLTYAGNPETLASLQSDALYRPSTFCSAHAAKANASAGVRMFSA